jgi:hypothetical protein
LKVPKPSFYCQLFQNICFVQAANNVTGKMLQQFKLPQSDMKLYYVALVDIVGTITGASAVATPLPVMQAPLQHSQGQPQC